MPGKKPTSYKLHNFSYKNEVLPENTHPNIAKKGKLILKSVIEDAKSGDSITLMVPERGVAQWDHVKIELEYFNLII